MSLRERGPAGPHPSVDPSRPKPARTRIVGLALVLLGILLCLTPLVLMESHELAKEDQLSSFLEEVAAQDPDEQTEQLADAWAFNSQLDPSGREVRDPFDSDIEVIEDQFAAPGQPFAHLLLPTIDVSEPIYLGASPEHLDIGAAHVDGTALPVGGEGTRSVIAGHRGGRTQYHFFFVDRLEPGDRIYVVGRGASLTYEVYGSEVIDPSEWDKLAAIPGEDTLTLLTCTPPPLNTQRLLINVRRVVETPASPTPQFETSDTSRVIEEAEGEPVATTVAVWRWGVRIGILVLSVALLATLLQLGRAIRGGRGARRAA